MDASTDLWGFALSAHGLAVVASLLTYVLTTRASRYRRPPSIAIAWVLGMLALPYLTLPAYLLFGRRKLVRRLAPPAPPVQGPARHWARALIGSFGLEDASPARVRLHADGGAAREALFATFELAQRRLDVCTFLIGDDPFGRETATRLIARARAGVRVRLLIDGVGALFLARAERARLAAGGVELSVFSPLLARRTSGPRNLRNHRKLVIADGARLWAGGRNLAAEYFEGRPAERPWRDLSLDLSGAVCAAAARRFETDWIASGGAPADLAADPGSPALRAGDAPLAPSGLAQFLPSGPDQTEDTVQALLIDGCFRAERRIVAVTPYFVPDAALETALRLAAHRGVEIDVCLPLRSNHRLADFARHRALRSLCDAGARFHLLPEMIHAKAVVIDDSLALCGSVNLDSRSLLLNYESALVLYGAAEIDWIHEWIRALLPLTRTYERRRPGLWRDVAEGLLLTLAYQL